MERKHIILTIIALFVAIYLLIIMIDSEQHKYCLASCEEQTMAQCQENLTVCVIKSMQFCSDFCINGQQGLGKSHVP